MIQNIPCRSNPMPYYTTPSLEPDYENLPMTFESIGDTYILFPSYQGDSMGPSSHWANSNYCTVSSLYYRIVDSITGTSDWVDWKAQIFAPVHLTDGQKMQLSGNNGPGMVKGWNYYSNRFRFDNSTGKLKLYGNISSLYDSNVTTIDLYHILYQGQNGDATTNHVLTDASKFIVPYGPYNNNAFEGYFGFNKDATTAPLFTTTTYTSDMFGHSYKGELSLSAIEVCFLRTSTWSFVGGGWFYNTNGPGIFIKPASTAMPASRSDSGVPSNFTILNRNNGYLYYAEAKDGHAVGDAYEGTDPY